LTHISNQDALGRGSALWYVEAYAQTAVRGFFVLSGFVIAYVVDTKERTGHDYFATRFARLYSVVIPALVLSIVCDWAHGRSLVEQIGRYIATFLLANNLWILPDRMTPLSNAPFWTMSYEATYYAMFGALIFSRGAARPIAVLILAAFAGPRILILAPIW